MFFSFLRVFRVLSFAMTRDRLITLLSFSTSLIRNPPSEHPPPFPYSGPASSIALLFSRHTLNHSRTVWETCTSPKTTRMGTGTPPRVRRERRGHATISRRRRRRQEEERRASPPSKHTRCRILAAGEGAASCPLRHPGGAGEAASRPRRPAVGTPSDHPSGRDREGSPRAEARRDWRRRPRGRGVR